MRLHFVAAIAALTLGATQAFALTANFKNDYSVTNGNPNGNWSYGYTTGLNTAYIAHNTSASNSVGEFWYTAGLSGDNTPSVFKNVTTGWVNGVAPGEVCLHSGPSGQFGVARYTSSEAGEVSISGFFGQGDIGSVGLYIYVDGVQKFGVADTNSQTAFSLTETLAVGSTIDFVVGNGFGGYSFDSTPLEASIQSVPEPASMALIGLGIAGMAAKRRRKN